MMGELFFGILRSIVGEDVGMVAWGWDEVVYVLDKYKGR
jgi:hypothetical protein